MIGDQLFLRNKVDGGVVIGEVVGHGFDGIFDFGCVCAVLKHNVALAGMLFARGQRRIFAGAHRGEGFIHGDGVLLGVFDAGNAADGVRMTLTDALAPEGVVVSGGQNGACVQAV